MSAEWPEGETLTERRRGRGPGRPKPRSRAFNSLGAKARSPRQHAGDGSSGRAGTHRPSGLRPRAPPGRSGSRGASSSRLRSPHRPPLPSPASRGPATPTPAGPRKRPVFPILSPERLPLRALSRFHFSVPNAAATSCHRPLSQHGGCSCLNVSRGLRELARH